MMEAVFWGVVLLLILREVSRGVFAFMGFYHAKSPYGGADTYRVAEEITSARIGLLRVKWALTTDRLPEELRGGRRDDESSAERGPEGGNGRVADARRVLLSVAENGRRFSGIRNVFTGRSVMELVVDGVVVAIAVWVALS
ncbi:hypothetical protein GCM10027294_02020 [Marinactinospora endophytica]